MSTPRIAVIVSQFNHEVTEGLLQGARAALAERLVPLHERDIFRAPGAFEIPLLAQHLAHTGRYDAIVCLGCVIKGDTAHFEYISQAASAGLMQAMLSTQVPMSFGILTTYTDEQAQARSQPDAANKGREAALAALEAAALKRAMLVRED
jgi:6,7-dimethyl-8-ribityllumazine synthase